MAKKVQGVAENTPDTSLDEVREVPKEKKKKLIENPTDKLVIVEINSPRRKGEFKISEKKANVLIKKGFAKLI